MTELGWSGPLRKMPRGSAPAELAVRLLEGRDGTLGDPADPPFGYLELGPLPHSVFARSRDSRMVLRSRPNRSAAGLRPCAEAYSRTATRPRTFHRCFASVALSADGGTAIVGGPADNGTVGAAWIYTQPAFAGTPGKASCFGQSVSALARQVRGLNAAAAALGFSDVRALQTAILAFCGR